jgi:hypothetical protein
MVGNPIHRWKRPVNKTAWKKRPSQNPAKPFADRKHDARKSAKPFGEKKFGEAPAKPAANKSYFKKDTRYGDRPAKGFWDERRFSDKPAREKLPYGHPAKSERKVADKRPETKRFAEKSERPLGPRKFWDRPAKPYGPKPEWQRYGHRTKSDKPVKAGSYNKAAPARKTYGAVFWDGKPRSKPPRTRKRV